MIPAADDELRIIRKDVAQKRKDKNGVSLFTQGTMKKKKTQSLSISFKLYWKQWKIYMNIYLNVWHKKQLQGNKLN